MSTPEYDWHDVYSRYVDLVSDAKDRDVIRDAADLPYPRKIIRATMLAFMRQEKDHQKRELMKTLYLTIANFQSMTAQEREAVQIMSRLDPALPDAELKKLAKRIATASDVYQAVLRRYESDLQQLNEDLNTLLSS